MERVQCIVVGAGVVGLSVARALAARGREVVVLESETQIGTGVSSRNSGVIHAGIYYEKDSLKARFCVQGKHALYRFCEEHGVPHARIGKLIVATDAAQLPALEKLRERARGNGVDDLEYLTPVRAEKLEPVVRCAGALLSPSTGIVDAHAYMLAMQDEVEKHNGIVALATPFVRASVRGNGLRVDAGGADAMTLDCDALVNCAGLGTQTVAGNIDGLAAETIPPLYPAKGNYFQLNRPSPFRRLIYPMPDAAWLGVHVGLDLAGRCKFGPDMHWLEELDYDVDESQAQAFYASIRRYWPDLPDGALQPDYTGIRPKIYAKGEAARDFTIQCANEHGVTGLVNLYGIESPGLTSAIAVGEHVAHLIAAEF